MKPITLMKLTTIKDPNDISGTKNLLVSKKYDGWLVQAIKFDDNWHIYSRRGEEKTENIPCIISSLNKMKISNNTFLLGEMVAKTNGKDDISKIQGIMGSSAEKGAEREKKSDIIFYIFDVLWENGVKIASKPFSDRLKILKSIVKDSDNVKKIPNKPFSSWQSVMKEAVKTGGEGIVLKDITKPYSYKSSLGSSEPKPGYWFKYKGGIGKSDSDDFVVYDHEVGEKGKDKFKFGQYYNGKLYGISEISNLSEKNSSELKQNLKSSKKPVIEIGFQERLPGGLRHQKFLRFRPDKKPKDAIMNEFHVKHIKNFESQNADDGLIDNLRSLISAEVEDADNSWRVKITIGDIDIGNYEELDKDQFSSIEEIFDEIQDEIKKGRFDDEILAAYEANKGMGDLVKTSKLLYLYVSIPKKIDISQYIRTPNSLIGTNDQKYLNNQYKKYAAIQFNKNEDDVDIDDVIKYLDVTYSTDEIRGSDSIVVDFQPTDKLAYSCYKINYSKARANGLVGQINILDKNSGSVKHIFEDGSNLGCKGVGKMWVGLKNGCLPRDYYEEVDIKRIISKRAKKALLQNYKKFQGSYGGSWDMSSKKASCHEFSEFINNRPISKRASLAKNYYAYREGERDEEDDVFATFLSIRDKHGNQIQSKLGNLLILSNNWEDFKGRVAKKISQIIISDLFYRERDGFISFANDVGTMDSFDDNIYLRAVYIDRFALRNTGATLHKIFLNNGNGEKMFPVGRPKWQDELKLAKYFVDTSIGFAPR